MKTTLLYTFAAQFHLVTNCYIIFSQLCLHKESQFLCISSAITGYTHIMEPVGWFSAHIYSHSLLFHNRTKEKCSISPVLPHCKEWMQETQVTFQAETKLCLQKVRAYFDQKTWITDHTVPTELDLFKHIYSFWSQTYPTICGLL